MKYEFPLTILTPTYNRAKYLIKLYESLIKQTVLRFQWLIIDDGSNDDTPAVIQSFNSDLFKIDYVKKDNGGKHTALNYSHPYIRGENVCIVDSDDWLLDNAVERIITYINEYKSSAKVKLLSFLRGRAGGALHVQIFQIYQRFLTTLILELTVIVKEIAVK